MAKLANPGPGACGVSVLPCMKMGEEAVEMQKDAPPSAHNGDICSTRAALGKAQGNPKKKPGPAAFFQAEPGALGPWGPGNPAAIASAQFAADDSVDFGLCGAFGLPGLLAVRRGEPLPPLPPQASTLLSEAEGRRCRCRRCRGASCLQPLLDMLSCPAQDAGGGLLGIGASRKNSRTEAGQC